MPGRAPKTGKWTARENRQKKLGVHLIVNGCVQVTSTNKRPRLTEPVGPGRKTQTLILDLSIETGSGPGSDVLVWEPASFEKKVTVNQYNSVDIHWDGKSIATCKVLDDGEHFRHLVQLTQAANAKFAKKPKPAAPSKPKAASRSKKKVVRPKKAKTAARAAGAGRARPKRKAPGKKKR